MVNSARFTRFNVVLRLLFVVVVYIGSPPLRGINSRLELATVACNRWDEKVFPLALILDFEDAPALFKICTQCGGVSSVECQIG